MFTYLITEDLFSPGVMVLFGVENLKDFGVDDDTVSCVVSSDSLFTITFINTQISQFLNQEWTIEDNSLLRNKNIPSHHERQSISS